MKKSFIAAGAFLTSFFVFSSFAYAQSGTVANASASLGGIAGLITAFTQTIVKATGGLLMAAAMVAFFYGLVQYIWGARQGDAKKISDGNTFIKWSLVALFVMFSVYGIIKWTQSTLCPTCDWATITIPDLNFRAGGTGQGLPQQGIVPPIGQGLPQQGVVPPAGSEAPQGSLGGSCGRSGYCLEGVCDAISNKCISGQ